ncbi:MAG TPA: OB-fold nucleic acid binding domain-containing protein, partial [Bacillota bacterium]|nr:OB-fold nucleic acid binding domain-containing protein [Bacillota bacterium]
MKDVAVKEIFEAPQSFADSEVSIRGWVRTNRSSNKFGFIELNDGSCFKSVQVVYEEDTISNFGEISKVAIASGLTVTGTLVLTPEAKQPFEVKASKILI